MVTAAASKNFSALSIFKHTVKIITTTMIYKLRKKIYVFTRLLYHIKQFLSKRFFRI